MLGLTDSLSLTSDPLTIWKMESNMIFTFNSKTNSTNHIPPNPTTDLTVLDDDDVRASKRSKKGCLTCKIRKKKCDESKPICSDCARLNKQCVYIDHQTMSAEEIRNLKLLVERNESGMKLRKRKKTVKKRLSASPTPNSPDISNLINHELMPKDLINPLGVNVPSTPNPPVNVSNLPKLPTVPDIPHAVPPQELVPVRDVQAVRDLQTVPRHSPPPAEDSEEEAEEMGGIQYQKLVKSPGSSPDILSLLKEMNPELFQDVVKSPNQFFSAAPINGLSPLSFPSPGIDFNQLFANINQPSPRFSPHLLPDLSDRAHYLFDYYQNVICPRVSVAPVLTSLTENYYQQIFLPLAHNDKGVLYSVLTWACFHLGGEENIKEGFKYIKMALDHFQNEPENKSTTINKLASLLLIVGAEICRGDVKNWIQHMETGWKIIAQNGGVSKFIRSKEEFWLVSNFAYHDVMSSNKAERGLYFSGHQYHEIFANNIYNGISHPLVGIAKDIYSVIGFISNLSYEANKRLQNLNEKLKKSGPIEEIAEDVNSDSEDEDPSPNAKINEILLSVRTEAMALDERIEMAKPNPDELMNLTEQEFEWQITLFETFKLSAKLYLRQAILKCNPSSIDSQILTNDLIKCLDIILGSPVEASLGFPVFMAGIHCVTPLDRKLMSERIERFIKTYGPWSINRFKAVIDKIWEVNPEGDRVVDWRAILKEKGWEINFG